MTSTPDRDPVRHHARRPDADTADRRDAARDDAAGGGDEDPMRRADAANGEPDATEE